MQVLLAEDEGAGDIFSGGMVLAEALCRRGVPPERLAESWSRLELPEPEELCFFCLVLRVPEGELFFPEQLGRLKQAAGRQQWDLLACTGSAQLIAHVFSREAPVQENIFPFVREVRAIFPEGTVIALGRSVMGLEQVWRSFRSAGEALSHGAPGGLFFRDDRQENDLVAIMTDHIRENFHRDTLTVREIAQTACLSTAYACTLFKSETGVTINRYISDCRIEKAKQLLADPRCKISDIARQTGYSDSNYFGKSFKRLVGLSPSEYREKGKIMDN